ncbi:MAG TPA: hypothetical protein PKJ14_01280 [Candidatus Cloacimonadota bacterium]|nr:hypothetical protein [Candidatus Cloacimonadota bacterium]HQL15018.1 hypothetical protein [Candidatus Cloacimonadota bacterium]
MGRYREIDLSNLKRYNAADRYSKVQAASLAAPLNVNLNDFWQALPEILKAAELREFIEICAQSVHKQKPLLLGAGGHVIKCGLAPLIIDLMKLGAIGVVAVNGAVVIHDYELAVWGKTSEDVDTALLDGSFGMAADTADNLNSIITDAYKNNLGLGEAVGFWLSENAPYKENSLLAKAYQYGVPVTVHVAIGTDIIHQHASADGAAIGAASLRDFRIFCQCLASLEDGGVFINLGSGVIIPEVFLKALSVARNLGHPLRELNTAVFDMNVQYRPLVNVTQRPVQPSGKGFYFVGHHELMLPLFFLSLKEKLTQ